LRDQVDEGLRLLPRGARRLDYRGQGGVGDVGVVGGHGGMMRKVGWLSVRGGRRHVDVGLDRPVGPPGWGCVGRDGWRCAVGRKE
jgi:hypothetical protein